MAALKMKKSMSHTTTNHKENAAMGAATLWQFVIHTTSTMKRNGRSTIIKCIIISTIALYLLRLFIDNESILNKMEDYDESIPIPAIRTNKIGSTQASSSSVDANVNADADFSVNFNINFNPQIVILAGPHKTASTTIQTFMVDLAGQTVSLEGRIKPIINLKKINNRLHYHVPHPSNHDWVWPLYSANKTRNEAVEIAWIKTGFPAKFYAPLLAWVTGRRHKAFTDKSKRDKVTRGRDNYTIQKQVFKYYRDLFQNVWNTNAPNDNKHDDNNNIDDGTPPPIWKKIVFGAEAFDTFVHDLPVDDGSGGNNTLLKGEDLHISPSANRRINLLLDIMPWYDKNKDTNDSSNNNISAMNTRRPELKLDDIEVVINYRTPRISHMISIWHQLGHKTTLQEFLIPHSGSGHYQLNSLGLALQFVRRGIKTTILDMKGVQEKEAEEEEEQQQRGKDKHNNDTNNILEIGGLQGVVACDVLKVSKMCNDRGKLMMSIDTNERDETNVAKDQNKKGDKNVRNLTEKQLNDIDEVINEYDCYVWKHLQKYNKEGKLRILHPSKSNTANLYNKTVPCGGKADDDNGKELTFQSMLTKIANIARVPYVDDSPPAAVVAEDPTEPNNETAAKTIPPPTSPETEDIEPTTLFHDNEGQETATQEISTVTGIDAF